MKNIFCIVIIIFSILVSVNFALAGDPLGNPKGGTPPGNPGPTELSNPLGDVTPQQLIGKIINAMLGIVGSLALAMFIYGGFTWMLASGNAEAVTKGKNILIWATIGLVVIFTSYALVIFVLKSIGAPGIT